jgi:hypothetical protein
VAVHAVLSRIHELIADIGRQWDLSRGSRDDAAGEYIEIASAPPRGLLGALVDAASQSDSWMLESLVCREAAAWIGVVPTDPGLVRHVRRHIALFRALGTEANKVYSDEGVLEIVVT